MKSGHGNLYKSLGLLRRRVYTEQSERAPRNDKGMGEFERVLALSSKTNYPLPFQGKGAGG